jgi:peptide/nickel transport system permease protein
MMAASQNQRALAYAGRELAQAASVLLGAYTISFIAIHLLPSDPITNFLVDNGMALDPDTIARMKAYYGFDRPAYQQFFIQLWGILHGNLGYALSTGRPVLQDISDVLPSTLRLTGASVLLTLLVTFLVVTAASLTRTPWLRRAIYAVPPLFSAIPTFWLGMVLLQALSFRLRVLSLFPDGSWLSLLVPALVLSVHLSAPLSQVMLKSVDTARQQPFINAIRAKGALRSWVYFRHLLKYAAGNGVTVLGLLLGGLLAGAVVTETVFSRPGVGRILQDAVANQDIALVQAFVLLIAALYVVVNFVVDLLYPLLDPRIVMDRDRPTEAGVI